jgi:type II secretory pathway component GspD/PulD (secretin)
MAQSGGTFAVTDDAYNDAVDTDLTNSELTKDSDGFGDSDETVEDKKNKKENLDMALIDVAIISSEEVYRSSKGVNLLNGLTLFYEFSGGNSQMASSGRGDKLSVGGVGGAGLNYALNIFSDAFDKNKILARPSLVVQNGKNSAFFSGKTMHVVLDGGDGAGSIEDIDTGIRLDVVAEFEDSDTITLAVMAERTGLEADLSAVSNSLGSPHFAKTVKTKVLGNLTLAFGETMVLSGLNEQVTVMADDKVPFLGDVPLVQYLFRNNVKVASKKSVLILLTPRRASLTDQQGEIVGQPAQYTSNNLRDLERNVPWMKPSPNLRAIVDHLGRYKYFNQFRKGDIVLKNWATENTLNDITGKTLDYLYIKYAS